MGRLNTTSRALIAAAVVGVFLMGAVADGFMRRSDCPYITGVIAKTVAHHATPKIRATLWLSGSVY
jgi:hypothetical protein